MGLISGGGLSCCGTTTGSTSFPLPRPHPASGTTMPRTPSTEHRNINRRIDNSACKWRGSVAQVENLAIRDSPGVHEDGETHVGGEGANGAVAEGEVDALAGVRGPVDAVPQPQRAQCLRRGIFGIGEIITVAVRRVGTDAEIRPLGPHDPAVGDPPGRTRPQTGLVPPRRFADD